MEITLNKNDLKEIDDIINHFVDNNQNETTSISALAFCLQKLMEGRKELEEILEREEDD
jgi:hypothetical protein